MAAVKPHSADHRLRRVPPSFLRTLAVSCVVAVVVSTSAGAQDAPSTGPSTGPIDRVPSDKDPPSGGKADGDSRPKAPPVAETKAGVIHPPDVDPAMSKPVPNVDPAMPKSPKPKVPELGPKQGEPQPSPDIQPR